MKRYLFALFFNPIFINLSLNATLININNWSKYIIIINGDQPVPESIKLHPNSIAIKKQICGNVNIQAVGANGINSRSSLLLNCHDPRVLDLTIVNDSNDGISASISFENRARIDFYKKIITSLKEFQKILIGKHLEN